MATKRYWMFSRPQRKLYRLPLTVAALREVAHSQEWGAARELHVAFEEVLEREGIKRACDRREGSGSGGRTHAALVRSLGLAFLRDESGALEFTLAGEALALGKPPQEVLSHQVLRFQYPSPYSTNSSVNIDGRFKLRPILLLLRLLLEPGIESLSQREIAFVAIVKGARDTSEAAQDLTREILFLRGLGGVPDPDQDFATEFGNPKDSPTSLRGKLLDIANTAVNWLEVTGLIERSKDSVFVPETLSVAAREVVEKYSSLPLISEPGKQENFQRKYGLPPGAQKDTRSFRTEHQFSIEENAERRIRTLVLRRATTEILEPVVTPDLIGEVSSETGFPEGLVAKVLPRVLGTDTSLDQFLLHYSSLVYDESTKAAKEFEAATANIIRNVFHLDATEVGSQGREPDIVVRADYDWTAVIDTKAYGAEYSLPSEHDRAMREYVENYAKTAHGVSSWAFICGAVKSGVSPKVRRLADVVSVPGTVIGMTAWLHLIKLGRSGAVKGTDLVHYLSVNSELTISEIERIRASL